MSKTKMKNTESSKYLTPILLVIIVILLVIILVICLKKDSNLSGSNNNYNYSEDTNQEINDNTINNAEGNNNNYISRDKALTIALDSLKINKSAIYDVNIELEKKYGEAVYEIDFNYNRYEYEVYVDAVNGKILHSFKEFD